MSGSKRAFGVKGFEPYENHDYICVVHGLEDRDDKGYDNSIKVIVDGKEEKVCPTCFHYKLNVPNSETQYTEFKKDGEKFIPVV